MPAMGPPMLLSIPSTGYLLLIGTVDMESLLPLIWPSMKTDLLDAQVEQEQWLFLLVPTVRSLSIRKEPLSLTMLMISTSQFQVTE